ncbi:N-terminal acetyltransferase A, auxiliary subunit [Trema orientale]|uniref:N-terminal acetyltransferase A, auxiliary subunit n=1 Tax=Trema orientale TaxID=63057 RepID=A0A2P5CIP1_TREOI|nr:N-terminal acetyltransferase A, auxiliary subunit [Trema orientale]
MSSSTLSVASSSSSSLFRFSSTKPPLPSSHRHVPILNLRASSSVHPQNPKNPIVKTLKNFAKAAILIGATASILGKSAQFPARAETPATVAGEQSNDPETLPESSSPLSEFLDSNSEAIEALKSLLQEKLEAGEDDEALRILKRLVSAQPAENEWKFLMARLLSEIGEIESARHVFEEILAANPLSFEALFENALLMDRNGEREAVIRRLGEALRIAEEENKAKEARDVKLIIAQIQFLQKNLDGALELYQELTNEDPNDFRPYFCRGMIYSLLDRNSEAKEQFAKYRELSPKKFEVEGYLRTPLSRMKLFGTDEN